MKNIVNRSSFQFEHKKEQFLEIKHEDRVDGRKDKVDEMFQNVTLEDAFPPLVEHKMGSPEKGDLFEEFAHSEPKIPD
jgi:hypothetical protein